MAKGRQSSNGIVVASPSDMDILCSKDKSVAKHPGNLVFRERIEQVTAQYSAATSKQEKMRITRDIVTFMQLQHGSRFLKQNGSDWAEITDQMARDKVSHALRFAAKNLARTTTTTTTTTTTATTTKKQRQGKKMRKRSMSSQSTASTVSTKSDLSTDVSVYAEEPTVEYATVTPEQLPKTIVNVEEEEEEEEYDRDVPVASIFMRQQSLLATMQKTAGGYMDFAEFQAKSLLPLQQSPEFTTLRAEDLNDLLRDPMFNSIEEWDVVEQMAEC